MSDLPWKSLGLAALIAGGAQIAALSGASATTLPVVPGVTAEAAQHGGSVVLVGQKKHYRHYKSWDEYHRHHGGHRYRYRRPGYGYYYHGYYYARPWWTLTFAVPLPGVVVVPVPGVGIQLGY